MNLTINFKTTKTIILFSLVYFLINLFLGIVDGGAHSDASDYITFANQIVNTNSYSQLFLKVNGREIFSLWLFLLVITMKIFGTYSYCAVVLTALISSFALIVFYNLLRTNFSEKTSLIGTLVLGLHPAYFVISHNALYDALLILFFVYSLYNYFCYFKYYNNYYLFVSALSASFMVFIHASGYPYVFFMCLLFPFLYRENNGRWRAFLIFSLTACSLPVFQMLVWKYFLYNSFYPYQELAHDWELRMFTYYKEGFHIRHYLRFGLIILLGYTPILLLTLLGFTLDVKLKIRYSKIFLTVFVGYILFLIISGVHVDYTYPFVVILIISYVLLYKKELLEHNPLVLFFGMMSLFTFSIYLRFFPIPYFHQKHFVYPILFIIPIFIYYIDIYSSKRKLILSAYIVLLLLLFGFGLYFQLPNNRNLVPRGFNVKYSSTFIFALPFTPEWKNKEIANWYIHRGITKDTRIATNLQGRYVNAVLNLTQNKYLTIIESYTFNNKFNKPTFEQTIKKINKFSPKYIHWDISLKIAPSDKEGIDGNIFTFKQFDSAIKRYYKAVDTLNGNIIFYERKQ